MLEMQPSSQPSCWKCTNTCWKHTGREFHRHHHRTYSQTMIRSKPFGGSRDPDKNLASLIGPGSLRRQRVQPSFGGLTDWPGLASKAVAPQQTFRWLGGFGGPQQVRQRDLWRRQRRMRPPLPCSHTQARREDQAGHVSGLGPLGLVSGLGLWGWCRGFGLWGWCWNPVQCSPKRQIYGHCRRGSKSSVR